MPRTPIGLADFNGASPIQRVASYAWLTQQITGRVVSRAAISESLERCGIAASSDNVAAVRKLMGSARQS